MQNNFPRQALPWRRKTKEWAKNCIKFADTHSVLSSSAVRKNAAHKKLNYDLLNGKLDMEDLMKVLNPQGFKFERKDLYKPINHYPIVNKVIDLLVGEEGASQLEFKAVITNPTAISEKEQTKKQEVFNALQQAVMDESMSEEDYQARVQEISKYFSYEYQDIREIQANEILTHYSKEQNYKNIFLDGFIDTLTVNEAIFQVTLEHGEPVLRKLNPCKVHVYGNGSSNRVEDADMIVIEDYWPLGRIIDTYYDKLSTKDIKFLDSLQNLAVAGGDEKYGDAGDPLAYFMYGEYAQNIESDFNGNLCFSDNLSFKQLPYDIDGNIRVLQVYWKSLKKIKEVSFYDEETGEKDVKFETEDYIEDKDKGEEVQVHYINEPWHGTMIGTGENAVFVDVGPCFVRYNSLTNPSKCHFGIIGQVFNYNEAKPYSIIDKVKPYSYLYDAIMDKLIKTMQNNLGKLVQFNEAMMPEKWNFEDWIYYAKTAGIVLVNPMKEGNKGAAKNKLAGAFQTPPVIDAELGNSIQGMINSLQYIEQCVANLIGITPQRLGSIQNRETVGGVERSTLQSSHVTRWYFEKYNDLKKRVYECVIDTAKIGMKGKNMKFQYITSDLSQKIADIDGEEFINADYGLVVNSDYDIEKFRQEIDQVAGFALQSQTISLSAYLKLKASGSLSEKIKMIEQNEEEMRQQQQEMQQQQMQLQQQQAQLEIQMQQAKMNLDYQIAKETNETKIIVASMQALNKKDGDGDGIIDEGENTLDIEEKSRQFDEKIKLEKDKLAWEKKKNEDNNKVKLEIAKMRPKQTSKTSKK